jgi:hypothetical protein
METSEDKTCQVGLLYQSQLISLVDLIFPQDYCLMDLEFMEIKCWL